MTPVGHSGEGTERIRHPASGGTCVFYVFILWEALLALEGRNESALWGDLWRDLARNRDL